MITAGPLDRRVTLLTATRTTDAFGGEVETWGELATVWASKNDILDSERVAAAEVGATVTTRFQVRWSTTAASLTVKDRLTCARVTYAITAIKELGRKEGLEITAAARAE